MSYNNLLTLTDEELGNLYLDNLYYLYLNSNPRLEKIDLNLNTDINEVNYSNNNLTDFPISLTLQELKCEFLNLKGNKIVTIKKDVFKQLNRIKNLLLGNNLIEVIENSAFSSLKSLLKLDLSNNTLFSLNDTSFNGLFSLNELDLSFNNLEKISAFIFNDLQRLEVLNISFNFIKVIENYAFVNLNALEVLDVYNNSLNDLFRNETLSGLGRIKYIRIDSQINLNMTVRESLVSSLKFKFEKRALDIAYYDSISIDMFENYNTNGSYSDEMCSKILYFVRKNILLNLDVDVEADFYVNSCQDWFHRKIGFREETPPI
jgi:Leucine-rich repeat (LRR) protein